MSRTLTYEEMTEEQRKEVVGAALEYTASGAGAKPWERLRQACHLRSLLPSDKELAMAFSGARGRCPNERESWFAGYHAVGLLYLEAAMSAVDHAEVSPLHAGRVRVEIGKLETELKSL